MATQHDIYIGMAKLKKLGHETRMGVGSYQTLDMTPFWSVGALKMVVNKD
jgi:hypothetical protein